MSEAAPRLPPPPGATIPASSASTCPMKSPLRDASWPPCRVKPTLVPPPLVAALAGTGMYLGRDPAATGAAAPAALAAAAGLALLLWAAATLWRARTTLNPIDPARAERLVTHGPFAHSRNPIYLGDALLLLGWALWLGDGMALLGLAGFVLWIDRLQIAAEERALTQRFGDSYRQYCARVRRWL